MTDSVAGQVQQSEGFERPKSVSRHGRQQIVLLIDIFERHLLANESLRPMLLILQRDIWTLWADFSFRLLLIEMQVI